MKRLVLLALAACQPSAARQAPLVEQDTLIDLVGRWRWLHRGTGDGTLTIEDEQWSLAPTTGSHLAGHYVRTVEVRSTDQVGFPCNQRLWYRQRATIDVVVELDRDGAIVARETGYSVEPSPCDHGFRHLASYTVVPRGLRMELRWDGGAQTLWHTADEPSARAAPSPAAGIVMPTGTWEWQTRSVSDEREVREEAEWWEITRRSDTTLDATYRRRVTVHSIDGSVIACAGAPSYSYDDAYYLDGEIEEEHWHLTERAVDAGTHPCLEPTPSRVLDEATAEQLGDHVVLEWRGKRRQVLHRPD